MLQIAFQQQAHSTGRFYTSRITNYESKLGGHTIQHRPTQLLRSNVHFDWSTALVLHTLQMPLKYECV